MALFIAKHRFGATEYTSRRTGQVYRIVPDDGGLCVQSEIATVWTQRLADALLFIEQLDFSPLASA